MSKYFDGELLSAYEDLSKDIEIHNNTNCEINTSFIVEKLEKLRKKFDCDSNCRYGPNGINIVIGEEDFNNSIDQLIAEIRDNSKK